MSRHPTPSSTLPLRTRSTIRRNASIAAKAPGQVPKRGEPPLFVINLSLPPRDRYRVVAAHYSQHLQNASEYFQRRFIDTLPFPLLLLARRGGLKRLHSEEETEEIMGIAEEAGVDMQALLGFNLFLEEHISGICGGIKIKKEKNQEKEGEEKYSEMEERMLLFRDIDCDEELRPLVIQLEYRLDNKTVARSITFAGYVGIIAGVRPGLSLTMNHRRSSTPLFQSHRLFLLLASRPSLASTLRFQLLSNTTPPLSTILRTLSATPSLPKYIVITTCTPHTSPLTTILEKPYWAAQPPSISSSSYLAMTSHDIEADFWDSAKWRQWVSSNWSPELESSREKKECFSRRWRETESMGEEVGEELVRAWLKEWPVRSERSLVGFLLDPKAEGKGLIAWSKWYKEKPRKFQ